jgi:hypothetical protein
MAPLIKRILCLLNERDLVFPTPPVSSFVVDYFVISPKGTKGRFQQRTGLTQIQNARSETAVLAYLRRRHPGTEIQIQSLNFV